MFHSPAPAAALAVICLGGSSGLVCRVHPQKEYGFDVVCYLAQALTRRHDVIHNSNVFLTRCCLQADDIPVNKMPHVCIRHPKPRSGGVPSEG